MKATYVRLLGCLICVAAAAWTASLRRKPSTRASHRGIASKYATDVEKLAKWCESNGLKQEAQKTRRVLSPTDPYKLYVPALPDEVGPPKLPDDASAKVVDWNAKLWKLRSEYAVTCYEMARRAIRSGRAGLAFVLVLDAIQANPDYEPVRRVLGYQKYQGQWRHVVRGAKTPQRSRLEREIRLAAESLRAPL